jgi:hypothetical protein
MTYPLAFFCNSILDTNLHHLKPADLRLRLSDLLSLQPLVEPGRLSLYAIFPAPLQSVPLVLQLSFDAAPSVLDGFLNDDAPKVQYEKRYMCGFFEGKRC